MADIADTAMVRRASIKDATDNRAPSDAAAPHASALIPLTEIPIDQWQALAERAIEPNGYYLPEWELAVNASAQGRTGASALARMERRPVDRADAGGLAVARLQNPAAGAGQRPPLRHAVHAAARSRHGRWMPSAQLMQQARDAGAHALVLRDMSLEGAAMKAFAEVLRRRRHAPARAAIQSARLPRRDARCRRVAARCAGHQEAEGIAPAAPSSGRAWRGRISTSRARRDDVAAALETFLALEASGWKGARGTALAQNDGDASFIRRATAALAASGQCEIVTLARRRHAGRRRDRAAASGPRVLLQDRRRRALCKILAGRAAHAGSDAASLRRSRDCLGRFHREPRSPHDQPDLARPLCDRRRADPAAAQAIPWCR